MATDAKFFGSSKKGAWVSVRARGRGSGESVAQALDSAARRCAEIPALFRG